MKMLSWEILCKTEFDQILKCTCGLREDYWKRSDTKSKENDKIFD